MAEVKLRSVTKSFGDVTVIHGVDLDIDEGEFVVFVGPSGCGKSTLLRMVSGLEEVTSGTMTIGGDDVTHVEPAERGVAMVFQSYALYPHMTVRDNMGFGLKMAKTPPDEIERRVKKAAEILHLDQLLDRKPSQLSGGQRQRVAIGRSIVREPRVFLFDEPLSNLDAELRVQMRLEIATLHQDLGATMIYVTHDQTEAMTLADKIVVLRAGRIEQVGSPLALYDNPNNQFVAGFIGSPKMNFLDAKVLGGGDRGVRIQLPKQGGAEIEMPLADARPEPGQPIIFGVRPEHLDGDGDGADINLTIEVSEHLGGTNFFYASGDGGETVVVEARDGRDVKHGDQTTVRIDPARSYLFDAEGQRLR